jgi:hypothetical protein
MKKIALAVLLFVTMCSLAGCVDGTYYPSSTTESSSSSSVVAGAATYQYGLEFAKQYLANYKIEMQKTKKDEYFQSAEWHAFVDSYWASYNETQKSNKNPEYMPQDQITY